MATHKAVSGEIERAINIGGTAIDIKTNLGDQFGEKSNAAHTHTPVYHEVKKKPDDNALMAPATTFDHIQPMVIFDA
jgi:hypothetical protein